MLKFFAKLNSPIAFIIVVVLFLALNSFLFYHYQQQSLPSIGATQPTNETQPSIDESYTDPSSVGEAISESEENAGSEEAVRTEEDLSSGKSDTAKEGNLPSQETEALWIVVSVVEASTWLSIQVDGQTVLEGLSEPGFSQRFEADREIAVSTGDAGVVLVEVNGYSLGPLGASGEAVARTFTVGP